MARLARFVDEPVDEDAAYAALRRAETIGRSIGGAAWLQALEEQTGRRLAPRRRRWKPDQKGIE